MNISISPNMALEQSLGQVEEKGSIQLLKSEPFKHKYWFITHANICSIDKSVNLLYRLIVIKACPTT
jgi:hypothetical protein